MEKFDNSSNDITQLYFKLANAGDLSAISALLDSQATYSSANMGLYFGITDIMVMMKGFYESYQYLNWQINSIQALTEYISEVHFTCISTDTNGESTERSGIERLVVVGGLIKHIEVR